MKARPPFSEHRVLRSATLHERFRQHLRQFQRPIIAGHVLVLILAIVAAASAAAQSSEPQTGASRVALASVTDPRNRPLVDVSADDFVIQEAGTAREILSVRPADYPIVVLLDTGGD